MNWIVLETQERLRGQEYQLSERKSLHVYEILRAKQGDTLQAVSLGEAKGQFLLLEEPQKGKKLRGEFLADTIQLATNRPQNLQLLIALQRPQTSKKIIQLAACLGVPSLVFFIANKSEKSYLNSPIWQEEALLHESILGMEQGGNPFPPKIVVEKNKYRLRNYLRSDSYFFQPDSKLAFLGRAEAKNPSLTLVFGPESGFAAEDIAFLQEEGVRGLQLSASILRTEYAFAYAMSQLELLRQ
ncbi:MAG: RsmE family RNA methyltransferase [Spirochaetota bacterium]